MCSFSNVRRRLHDKEIAADFKRRGIKNTRGTDFTINTISNLLSNRRYIGEYKYSDIVILDGIPAIVDKDLFDRVQQQIEKNKKAPARYKADADYILTTKLYCGKCMSFMVGESGTSHNATTYRYYKCITAKRKKGCDKKAVKKDWIEEIVINQIKKVIFDDDLIEAIAERVYQLQDQENTTVPLLKKSNWQKQKRALKMSSTRLSRALSHLPPNSGWRNWNSASKIFKSKSPRKTSRSLC